MAFEFRERKFYGLHISRDVDIPLGEFASFYYLHGEADYVNGYDLCTFNEEAESLCSQEGAFLCEVVCIDGTVKDAICFSYLKHGHRMSGLICFLDDEINIEYVAKKEDIFTSTPRMFFDEVEYLKSINKYHLIKH